MTWNSIQVNKVSVFVDHADYCLLPCDLKKKIYKNVLKALIFK